MSASRVKGRIVVVSLIMWAALIASSASAAQIASVRDAAGERAAVVGEISFVGLRRISPETLTSKITSRPGIALDERKVERDVRTLARLGWFADVRVETANLESLGNSPRLRLTFYVPELPFLTVVEFTGSRLLSRQQIEKLLAEKKVTPKLGEPENAAMLHRAAREIESALAELGHPDASVVTRREETAQSTVRERFEVDDGPHVPVGRLTFTGDPQISSKALRRQMRQIVPSAWFASLRGKDSFTRDAFEDDRARLLAYYQNHGYPDARIGAAKFWEYQESSQRWFLSPRRRGGKKLAVAIPVEAGDFYRTTSVDVSAALHQATGVSGEAQTEQLRSLVNHGYSAKSVENLRRALEMRARANAKKHGVGAISSLEAVRTMDAETHTVRIRFDLSSAPPYIVRRLIFRGMQHFPDRYFRRHIGVKEGAPLDERALEAGLARLARTGYFKPIKKEDVHIEPDDGIRSVDVTIRIQELGQQRFSLVGGHGQFGSTLGIAYSLFNLLDREELLTSKIEGGPESLQLAIGLAKEGFLGSRGSLALSVFDMFLRPRLTGSVKGPFFQQRSEAANADYSYALTTRDVLTANYGLSYSDTTYSPTALSGSDSSPSGNVHARFSSRYVGFGWTRNTGDQQTVLADSVSGGWLGGSENLLRSKAEYGRIFRDPIFNSQNAWAFRTTFSGVGSYSGNMPPAARWYSGDEFVRGLRDGELGPQAVVSSIGAAGTTRYSTAPAGANLIGAANAEYRVRLGGGTEGVGFFDLGSGLLQQNWLGHWRSAVIDSTNGIVHGSTGIELRWTLPGIGVPVRAYYALNVLRLNRSVWMPDGSLLHLHNPLGAFGWGLGSLF
jgi:outer membrane protein insertion porin family